MRNVTLADDSLYGSLGSYECHGFVEGEALEKARHGFSVSVITSKSYTLVNCSFYYFNVFLPIREICSPLRKISLVFFYMYVVLTRK